MINARDHLKMSPNKWCRALFWILLFAFQYAAIIKRKVREFVNRGGNASNSLEFATAISSSAGVANCLVLHGGTTEETPNPAVAIPNIKDLNDFQFHPGGILFRKSSGYGTGKNIDFQNTAVEHFRVKTEFHPCDIMD